MGAARWIVHSSATFEARHALATYKGEAEEPHSHEWKVSVRVGTEELNSEGYALDFHDVHSILFDAVTSLEGTDLNDHPTIGNPSPTAEHLAEVLADFLTPKFGRIGGRLLSVSVWEGPENRVDLNLDI
jgi:6-pyruvoyl-tetrahydropterin synthase